MAFRIWRFSHLSSHPSSLSIVAVVVLITLATQLHWRIWTLITPWQHRLTSTIRCSSPIITHRWTSTTLSLWKASWTHLMTQRRPTRQLSNLTCSARHRHTVNNNSHQHSSTCHSTSHKQTSLWPTITRYSALVPRPHNKPRSVYRKADTNPAEKSTSQTTRNQSSTWSCHKAHAACNHKKEWQARIDRPSWLTIFSPREARAALKKWLTSKSRRTLGSAAIQKRLTARTPDIEELD